MTLAELEVLFENQDWQTLRDRASVDAAPEIADLLHALERPNRMLLFRALSRDVAAEVFVPDGTGAGCIAPGAGRR